MTALEAREVEDHDVRMPGRELGGPHLLDAVRGVVLRPDVLHRKRRRDEAPIEVVLEESGEPFRILGNRSDGQDRIAERLILVGDAVMEPRIEVVRPPEKQNTDLVLLLQLLEQLEAATLHLIIEQAKRLQAFAAGVVALVLGDSEPRTPGLEHLPGKIVRLLERHRVVHILDAGTGEEVDLLGERRPHDLRGAGHDRATGRVLRPGHERRHVRDAWEEDVVELPLDVLLEDQIVDVGLCDLGRIARVDRPVARTLSPHLFRRGVAEDDVRVGETQRLEVCAPDRRGGIQVEHTRDADANVLPSRDRTGIRAMDNPPNGFLSDPSEKRLLHLDVRDHRALRRNRLRRVEVPKGQPRLVVDKVGIARLEGLAPAFEHSQRLDGFDRPFFAAEARDVAARPAVGRFRVDECSRAVVRAEMARRRLIVHAREAEIDRGVEADERGRPSPAHDSKCLDRRTNSARLAWVRMHLDARAGHAFLDVVDLRLDCREVVLRPALEHVAGPELRESRNLDDVLPHVLGQHHRQAREELLLRVAFLLEIHTVRIEEHGATVAELRAQRCLERGIRVLGHRQAELVRHGLEQHAVAGRALVREPEIPDLAVDHEQDLDVLPADVADHVDVAAVLHRGHHVRDGLDDVDISAERLLKDVGGVARGAESDHFQLRALVMHEALDLGE